MKNSISTKFFGFYLLLGLRCFLMVAAGGSYFMEKRLEQHINKQEYSLARRIAKDYAVLESEDSSSDPNSLLFDSLDYLGDYHTGEIWIADVKKGIYFSNARKIPVSLYDKIPVFFSELSSDTHYEIGTFFDFFSTPQLTTAAKITVNSETQGYVLIHYPLREIYQERDNFREVMLVIFLQVYAVVFLLLVFQRIYIHEPLQEIVKGAANFGSGNLDYKIPVKRDDEMGYLANSLNYMADRLNENGEYQRRIVANVSHDFRSPLTSIRGYVQAMLDGTIPPEMQEKYLKIISYESERLEKLTKNLMVLGKLDDKKRLMNMKRFDINHISRITSATFEGRCTERFIHLELHLAGKELFVRADMDQIQQVLYNLLDNAIKFSQDHSSILLETTEKNGKVFVSVKDHGIGIPKDSLSKIWDRFYKLDASRGKDRKGSGLGLAIVKEIINAHGENLNVISTEGVGTEFIFSLEKAK